MTVYTGQTASLYLSGTPVTLTAEATTEIGSTHKIYQITNTAKQTLDRKTAYVVETSPDNSTWSTAGATTYTVEPLTGTVTFASANAPGTHVRISGKYRPLTEFANGKEWGLSIDANMLNCTTFKSTWKQQTIGTKEGSVTFSQFYSDSYFLDNLGTECVACLWVDETNRKGYKAYVYVKSDAIKTPNDDLITEDVSFDVDCNIVAIY